MFKSCKRFDCNLNKWNVQPDVNLDRTFSSTKLEEDGKLPKWYKK
jgi:hypothetical protein